MTQLYQHSVLRFSLIAGLLVGGAVSAAPDPTPKQQLVKLVSALSTKIKSSLKKAGLPWQTIWSQTHNPRQRDQLYAPEYARASGFKVYDCSLFFMRAADLDNELADMLDLDLLIDPLKARMQLEVDPAKRMSAADAEATATAMIDQLKKMTFQEHRLGLGFEYSPLLPEPWFFSVRTWAGLSERNFWLDKEERATTAGLVQRAFPDTDGEFNENDYIAMRWGLGDTRVRFGCRGTFFESPLLVGIQATLPTARSVSRPTKNKVMPLDVNVFFKQFLLDRAREVLIEPQLGSSHYAIGCFSRFEYQIPRTNFSLALHGQVDYQLPTGEERYLTLVQQKKDNGTDLTITAGAPGTEVGISSDDDIRRYIYQYFLPQAVSVVIAPGFTAQAGGVAAWRKGAWRLFGGYDYFYKTAEELAYFRSGYDESAYLAPHEAMAPCKQQHCLLGGMTYDAFWPKANLILYQIDNLDVTFKLQVSGAVHAQGMASDITVQSGVIVKF